jgi:hypothetical protein
MLDMLNTIGSTHLNAHQIDSPLGAVKPMLRKIPLRRGLKTVRFASRNLFDPATETTVGSSFYLNENLSSIINCDNIYLAFTRPEVGFDDFVAEFLRDERPSSGLVSASDAGWEPQFSAR